MKILFLLSTLLLPELAWAYLDPGSGNALLYLLISLFGAVTYFVKSFFYRCLSFIKGEKIEVKADDDLMIFSEGKNYWLTYKPIIEKLLERKIPFTYLTMDVEDPALTIENDLMHSKYVGEGTAGFSKIARSSAKIMLTTTPNIGCPGFPLPRPKNVQCLAHVWHSVCDTGFYHMGALDQYDTALTIGDWVQTSIRKIENSRNLKPKEVVAVGLPYLDELAKTTPVHAERSTPAKILVAPSWGPKSCLAVYGTEFLIQLAQEGYEIIVRPHPQSLKVEMGFIKEMQEALSVYETVHFDFQTSGAASMAQADLLISDKSSIRFDFAFLYEKPVLTLDIPLANLDIYEASLLGTLWEEGQSARIGMRMMPEEKEHIVDAVRDALNLTPTDIRTVRSESISHWGHSDEAIVNWVEEKLKMLNASGQ